MLSSTHLRLPGLWLAVGVLMLLLVAVSSVISIPVPVKVIMLQDKVIHTLAYACLMGWFSQIYRHDLTRLMLAAGLVMMGIGIEFLQAMVPSRDFELLDMVANTSGVVLAWALAYTWVGNVLPWFEGLLLRKVSRA